MDKKFIKSFGFGRVEDVLEAALLDDPVFYFGQVLEAGEPAEVFAGFVVAGFSTENSSLGVFVIPKEASLPENDSFPSLLMSLHSKLKIQ